MRRQAGFGYTVVEVMIFLMITGFLFGSAALAVRSSQSNVQYSQAVRDFELQLKDVSNDVSNGYYPKYTVGSCEKTSGANPIVVFNTSTTQSPGTNEGCVNVGKIMMFNTNGGVESFGVGTIAGVNPGLGSSIDLDLPSIKPLLAYAGGGTINLTDNKPIRYDVRVTKIGAVGSNTTYSSLSFISNLSSSADSIDEQSENGTLAVSILGIPGNLGDNTTLDDYYDEVESLGNAATTVSINPNEGFYICLITNDERRARVILGIDGVITATRPEFDLDSGAICP